MKRAGFPMPWQRVTFDVPPRHAEALSEALLALGAAAVELADAEAGSAQEQSLFDEPGEPIQSLWPRCRLSVLFAPGIKIADALALAGQTAGVATACSEELGDEDWVRVSHSQFTPIRISDRLWIVPTWHTPPDPKAINLRLDPGRAFGTGAHPTTRLCLHWLEKSLRGGESVIDYGCGSGILAIAALKLGAGAAVGVDLDPEALLASGANAMQNQVEARFQSADALLEPADMVVANILAYPLIELAPMLASLTSSNGRIALSGILEPQARAVVNGYVRWFEMTLAATDEGWVLLAGKKRAP
jgi:ribosomal protein L11 methyltransferase